MGLPKLNTPIYELVLPSTEETIKYRPFLVKEQKLLLLAQESENKKDMLDAISQIIENCTFGKINGKESYVFDVEYVFLQIRRKSIGDKITLNLLCDDDGTTRVPTEIDLNDVKVEIGDNHTNKIQLTDDVQLIMTYPKIYTIKDINPDNSYDIVTKCVHQITEGDKVYEKVDMSDADLIEFIESMNTDNLNDVLDFFDTMPKIKYQINIMNPNTNVENTINMEGIESFFL